MDRSVHAVNAAIAEVDRGEGASMTPYVVCMNKPLNNSFSRPFSSFFFKLPKKGDSGGVLFSIVYKKAGGGCFDGPLLGKRVVFGNIAKQFLAARFFYNHIG